MEQPSRYETDFNPVGTNRGLVEKALRSARFLAGTVGWKLSSNGGSELNSPTINSPTFGGSLTPTTSNGGALGSTTKQWSDLFLAEGGVINWDAGDVTLTQTNNILALAGGDLEVPDEAYDATGWNGDLSVPTKNAIRDKVEDILDGVTFTGDIVVPDEAYGVGWNSSTEVPTKNAVYDKMETRGQGAIVSGMRGYQITQGFGDTFYGDSGNGLSFSSTEAEVGNITPITGTLKNLYVDVVTNTINSGTIVFAVMKNGVATAVTVTVNAGVTGITGDTTNSVAVSGGDRISVRSIAGGTSGEVQWCFSYQIQ